MPVNNLIYVIKSDAEAVIDPADPLEERCRKAMEAVKDHWLTRDEDLLFKAAVVAVYLKTDDIDEQRRIVEEMSSLRDLAAMLSGVPVDLAAVTVPMAPIGLAQLWRQVTGKAAL